MFASTAVVVLWTTVYLTGYSGYLIGFREPLSPQYRCHGDTRTDVKRNSVAICMDIHNYVCIGLQLQA